MLKQVIVVRKDLGMRKGKMCAQAAHASLTVCMQMFYSHGNGTTYEVKDTTFLDWYYNGQTKIVVSVNSEEELIEIYRRANDAGINASLITDAGKTEFKEPTKTAVAVGPDWEADVNLITGHLPLI